MKLVEKHIHRKITAVVCMALGFLFHGCEKNRINAGSTNPGSGSIYANPDTLTFSAEHHAYMLNTAYLSLAYTYPPQSEINAILDASDQQAAEKAYDDAIDNLVDSGAIKERLIDYGINLLGVGNKYTGTEEERYPANLFAYVVLTGRKIDDFLLATYAIDDSGAVVSQTYAGGPPTTVQAGYITMEEYTKKYMNAFMFKMIREILAINLITKAPFNGVNLYRWTEGQINPKYTEQENNPLICFGCHSAMNAYRSAFHKYAGAYNTYSAGTVQGTNQYGQEDPTGNPLEPRANGTPLSPAQGAPLYKLTENGEPIASPRDFAKEVIKHERFDYAWTVRLLTILLNIDEGHPGTGGTVPNPFEGNEAQKKFADEWTAKFKDMDRKPKAFIKAFLKSNAYLVTGYNPDTLEGVQ